MNSSVDTFKILLEQYKLSEPVSPKLQGYIIKQRKADLKQLMKKTGQMSVIFWLAVIIYEGLKEIGIKLTFIQAKIILGITATAIASGSTAGVYKGAKYVSEAIRKPKIEIEEKLEKPNDEERHLDRVGPDQRVLPGPKKIEKKTDSIETIKESDTKAVEPDVRKLKKKNSDTEMISDVPTL